MNATYTKLRDGQWGLRVQDPDATTGQTVTVVRRDGRTVRETIGRVVLRTDDGVTIAEKGARPSKPGATQERQTCPHCGGSLA